MIDFLYHFFSMFKDFKETIKEYKLIERGDKVLIGLSGGADSVYLLRALISIRDEYNLVLKAAHINHGIRETAYRDEKFVEHLSKVYDIELFTLHENINDVSKRLKISSEDAGRRIRYEFFNSIEDVDKIALAHNFDDDCETILFRIIRGTGIKGLLGIPIKREKIIRPILNTKRKTIELELKEMGQDFMIDETNLENIYTRNKIRNVLIPLIENEFNPSFKDSLKRLKKNSYSFSNSFLQLSSDFKIEKKLSIEELKKLSEYERKNIYLKYLEKFHDKKDISNAHLNSIDSLLFLDNNKGVDIANGLRFVRNNDKIFTLEDIYKDGITLNKFHLKLGKNKTDFGTFYVSLKKLENAVSFPKYFLDELYVRSRENGDRFKPSGMNGTKKLKDFFNDIKIPPYERDFVPIITYKNEIIYVVPYRASNTEITDEKIWIRWENNEGNDR